MPLVLAGATSGSITIDVPATAGTNTLTIPASTGTVITTVSSTGINASAISTGTLAEAYGGTGTTTGYYGFKNRIINGAMVIDQRNAGASVTPTSSATGYVTDRWALNVSQNSKFSAQQTTGFVGFSNSLLITSLSAYSVTSGDYFMVDQNIEGLNVADLGWGTANAQPVTLSFKVKSSLTGTFGGVISNSASNRSYPFSYTISTANTETSISITIAGDTSGTWLTTNGVGIRVRFSMGAGTTYQGTAGAWAGATYLTATGATSVVGTNGATFYLTGCQLEVGSTATSFDYRPYGTELQLCQRYYYGWIAQQPNTGVAIGQAYNTGTANGIVVKFPTTLRTIPTFTYSSAGDFNLQNASAGGLTVTNITLAGSSQSTDFALLSAQVASGLTAGNASFMFAVSTNGRLNFSAEL